MSKYPNSDIARFDLQFRETDWEVQKRWERKRKKEIEQRKLEQQKLKEKG